ncbi:MAG: septal ring factor EnvC (AmiA/AmiB activator), partial [Bacillariaceae sp.]
MVLILFTDIHWIDSLFYLCNSISHLFLVLFSTLTFSPYSAKLKEVLKGKERIFNDASKTASTTAKAVTNSESGIKESQKAIKKAEKTVKKANKNFEKYEKKVKKQLKEQEKKVK